MSPIIAGIASAFSVAALVFYIVAASGYSKDHKVLEGCQWFYYNGTQDYYEYDYKLYFGLKGFLFAVREYDYRRFYNYDTFNDESDDFNLGADKCNSSGKSAFALTVVACVLSFITIITNGAGFKSEETVMKGRSAVLSIISSIFGIIAVGVFMTTCYKKIFDDVDYFDGSDNDLHYGNGSILVITALICNFFAFILAIVNIIVGSGHNPPLPVPVPVATLSDQQ